MKLIEWIRNLSSLTFTIVAGLLIWSLFFKPEKDPAKELIEYWEKRGFKTDTVYVEVDYSKLPKPVFEYTVPPAKVYNYPQVHNGGLTDISIDYIDLYIHVIDSLQQEITKIHENYLKLQPEAPKVLYGEFSRDSLEVDLLNINGDVQTSQYGVNYDRFTYQWVDGTLKANPMPLIKKKYRPEFSLYGYGGYDLLLQSPLVRAEYNMDYRRFRVQGAATAPIQNLGASGLSFNLGYRIK